MIARLTAFLLDHSRGVIRVVIVIVLVTALMIPLVEINYDLAKYLPPQYASRQALDLLEAEFGYNGVGMLMAEGIGVDQALELKQRLAAIEGVDSVLWLDDVADLNQPLSYIPADYRENYYADNCALFMLNFVEDDYSLVTGAALVAAREAAAEFNPAIYGTAEESRNTRQQVASEMLNVMLVIVPACLLILLVISSSWFEPLLYIFVICLAVVMNMGSNLLLDSVSFITFSMGAVIQLAVSMDYSIFLTHRFEEERRQGLPVRDAVIRATSMTFPSIAASAMTTVAGFTALAFMQYGIGRDIGLVLAKGVILSFLAVIFFLPPMLLRCHHLVERSRHRTLVEVSLSLGRRLTAPRYLFLLILVLLVIPCYFGQLNTAFLYGDSSGSSASGQIAEEKERIKAHFPLNDQLVLVFPNGDIAAERELAARLEASPYVDSVQALVTMVDPAIPRNLLPAVVRDNFEAENYGRMIVNVNTVEENADMFACVDLLKSAAADCFGQDCYLVGKAASVVDIRDSVLEDFRLTQLFSILAVGLVIMITFRSLIVPVLLVAAIQSAIFINMAFPYFLDQPLVFIGYLVVSSLQLGATIDYAILLASRYTEARRTLLPRAAAAEAVHRCGVSVLTSGLILTVAGTAEARMSQMEAVSSIGQLLGRGALVSMIVVLLVVPALLTLFDRPIRWLTMNTHFCRPEKRTRPQGRKER